MCLLLRFCMMNLSYMFMARYVVVQGTGKTRFLEFGCLEFEVLWGYPIRQ